MERKYVYMIIGGSAILAAAGTGLYLKNRGNNIFTCAMNNVNALKHENDSGKKEDETIADLGNQTATQIATDYVKAGHAGATYAQLLKTKNNIPVSKLVVNFNTAMQGLGTNTQLFYDTLYAIQNKFTLHVVTEVYQAVYKRPWINDVLAETALTGSYQNVKTLPYAIGTILLGPLISTAALVSLSNKLNPQIINYLDKLPVT